MGFLLPVRKNCLFPHRNAGSDGEVRATHGRTCIACRKALAILRLFRYNISMEAPASTTTPKG